MQHTDKYNFSIIEASDTFSPEALNTNARAVEAQLDAVRGEFAAADAALDGKLSAEKTRVDAALAAKAAQTALDALTKTVAVNKSAADTALATKAAQTALDALTKTVTDNKSAADTALAAKAAQTALDALCKTVASNKSAADTALAAKAAQTALDALTKTVTANKSAADSAVAAEKTAREAALDALTKTVAANKSAADTALAAKAAQTALTALTTRVTALEKGQLRFKYGTYKGAGTYGQDHPNRLEFDFKPLAIFIAHPTDPSYGGFLWIRGMAMGYAYHISSHVSYADLIWEDRAVLWSSNYSNSTPVYQLNESGRVYPYFALGISE